VCEDDDLIDLLRLRSSDGLFLALAAEDESM